MNSEVGLSRREIAVRKRRIIKRRVLVGEERSQAYRKRSNPDPLPATVMSRRRGTAYVEATDFAKDHKEKKKQKKTKNKKHKPTE